MSHCSTKRHRIVCGSSLSQSGPPVLCVLLTFTLCVFYFYYGAVSALLFFKVLCKHWIVLPSLRRAQEFVCTISAEELLRFVFICPFNAHCFVNHHFFLLQAITDSSLPTANVCLSALIEFPSSLSFIIASFSLRVCTGKTQS